MVERNYKTPPCDLKRNNGRTMVEQATDGIRRAIVSGCYRPCDGKGCAGKIRFHREAVVPDLVLHGRMAGGGSVQRRPLTRMEMDPIAHGETIARCVVPYLKGAGFPEGITVGPRYVMGDSFPEPDCGARAAQSKSKENMR